MSVTRPLINQLCLHCGMCCDGTLFRDVELQSGEDPARWVARGLPVRPRKSGPARLPQPCAALGGDCRCAVYRERPARCRQFECTLLQAAHDGSLTPETARRHIRSARRLADRVRGLLRELGDDAEHLPLAARMRRMRRRCEAGAAAGELAERFGELTLAWHQLTLLLGRHFYPGDQEGG